MALSADGGLLASGSFDRTVRLWEVAPGTRSAGGVTAPTSGHPVPAGGLLATLQGHAGSVQGVALSADGRLLASGGGDGTIRLWEATSGTRSAGGGSPWRLLTTLKGHTGLVWAVALSGDGALLASGSFDGTVRLWATAPGTRSAGGATAPTGGYPVPAGRLLATLRGHTGGVWGVALSGDGALVASGGFDGTVRLWDTGSGRTLATLHGHTGTVVWVALSEDGGLLASGSTDGTVRLWETTSGRPLAVLEGHTGVVYGVALSRDGQLLASGSLDGTIRLWETTSGACLHNLRYDRRYERLDITGLSGVTEVQRTALLALGAVDRGT